MKNKRIIYMGTPEFAVLPLKKLVDNGYHVVSVVTMPDKQSGRGMHVQYSPVKQYAINNGLTVLQPENLKDEAFIEELRSYQADLQIVVAFRMLPEAVWNMPPMGTFNLHASLLPQYRGAAPINWAVINGEKETGVPTFFLQHKIDTGHSILQEKIDSQDSENVEIVYNKLMRVGSDLVLKTLDLIGTGKYELKTQASLCEDDSLLRTAPKIFKETCQINWNKDVTSIYNLVRGLSPYPAAWSTLKYDDKETIVKIFETEKGLCQPEEKPGSVITDGKSYLKVAASNGYISIKSLQLAGKKRLKIEEFLCGFNAKEVSFI